MRSYMRRNLTGQQRCPTDLDDDPCHDDDLCFGPCAPCLCFDSCALVVFDSFPDCRTVCSVCPSPFPCLCAARVQRARFSVVVCPDPFLCTCPCHDLRQICNVTIQRESFDI